MKTIDAAVAVVIQPGGADRPAGNLDAGFRGHVLERSVALVAIQDRPAVAGDEQVHEAVVIVIGCDRRHAEQVARRPRQRRSRRVNLPFPSFRKRWLRAGDAGGLRSG